MSNQIVTYINSKGKMVDYELPGGFDINTITNNERVRKAFVFGLSSTCDDDVEYGYLFIKNLTPVEQLILLDEYSRITGLSLTAISALGSAFENGYGQEHFGYTYDMNMVGEGFVEYVKNALTNSIFKNHFSIDVDDEDENYRFINIDVTSKGLDDEYDKLESLFEFIEGITAYCNSVYTIYSEEGIE